MGCDNSSTSLRLFLQCNEEQIQGVCQTRNSLLAVVLNPCVFALVNLFQRVHTAALQVYDASVCCWRRFDISGSEHVICGIIMIRHHRQVEERKVAGKVTLVGRWVFEPTSQVVGDVGSG